MDELLDEFLIESRDLVQQASEDLMALESNPADAARLASAFRAVHTLKGSVALFDFAPMGRALHVAEDLLGAMRDRRVAVDRAVLDPLLDCIGATDGWIQSIEKSGALPADADAEAQRLSQALAAPLRTADKNPDMQPAAFANADWLPGLAARWSEALRPFAGRAVRALRYTPHPDCFFMGTDPLELVRTVPDLLGLDVEARDPWSPDKIEPFSCNLVFTLLSAAPADELRRVFRLASDQILLTEMAVRPEPDRSMEATTLGESQPDAASRSLRVDTARIDHLVDIVGELLVAKNRSAVSARAALAIDPTLARTLAADQAEIGRLVGDMHRAVMGLRMTPLGRTFRRLPRLVRDVAGKLGKTVDFTLGGEDVEADKAIVDALFEPLLHVLRNALDHGVEAEAVRRAAGKPATGRVTLQAHREADRIVIAVSDDGAGIDLSRIRAIAKARRVMSDDAVDALDDAGVLDLVFAPGFSTAAAVTDISGRGVGMDAVRTAIASLGGRVAITSQPGHGSTLRLSLPQTAAVITVMTVLVGTERFGVPIEAVQELIRIGPDRIIPIRNGAAFVLRDRTLPLVRLAGLLDLPDTPRPAGAGAKVLIVGSGDQQVGLEIDGLAENTDVLLRPMGGLLAGMPGLQGTAVLGDGRVLMVLNLPELIG